MPIVVYLSFSFIILSFLQLEEKADQRVKIKDRDNNWMGGLIGGQKNTRRLVFTHRSKVASDADIFIVIHMTTIPW